jgi:hypothetical protein
MGTISPICMITNLLCNVLSKEKVARLTPWQVFLMMWIVEVEHDKIYEDTSLVLHTLPLVFLDKSISPVF